MVQLIALLVCFLEFLAFAWAEATLTPPPLSLNSTTAKSSSTSTITSSANATSTSTSANATATTSLPSLGNSSVCVNTCFELAVSNVSCNSVAQLECYCTSNNTFPGHLISCISQDCPDQLSAAENLTEQFCAIVSTSVSFSITSISETTTASSNSSTATSPSTTQSTTTTTTTNTTTSPNSASRTALGTPWEQFNLYGIGATLLAAVAGAMLV